MVWENVSDPIPIHEGWISPTSSNSFSINQFESFATVTWYYAFSDQFNFYHDILIILD